MDLSEYPPNVQKYILELVKRNVIKADGILDRTLVNYLIMQKYDEDYIRSMMNDRWL
jgi:hypothetical protein